MNALKYKIFVYGTLKRGEPNHEELLKRKAKFVAQAKTVDKWPLIIASECNLPFILNKKNFGKHIFGEIYMIDQETKLFLDYFEGVEDNLYKMHEIEVIDKETDSVQVCSTYILDNFNETLINNETILFDNYSSVNSYFDEYKKNHDTPENLNNLLKQVKKF